MVWPFVRMLNRQFRIPIVWGAMLGIGLLFVAVLWIIWGIGERLLEQTVYLVDNLPIYIENLCAIMNGVCGKVEQFFHLSEGCMMEQMERFVFELQSELGKKALPYIMNSSVPFVGQLIDLFTAGTITILAAVLILQERDRIKEWKQNSLFRREIQLLTSPPWNNWRGFCKNRRQHYDYYNGRLYDWFNMDGKSIWNTSWSPDWAN